MILNLNNHTIHSIIAIIPKKKKSFLKEMKNFNFSPERSRALAKIMGYKFHRIVNKKTCSSDLLKFGFEKIINKNYIKLSSIDALIVVTQSPDYFIPSVSSILHGLLKLKKNIYCVDINDGCSGFLTGLIHSLMLLDQKNIKRVALCNVEVLSKKVNINDRNSYPLVGDAASIVILDKNTTKNKKLIAITRNNGLDRDALMIPAGGFKMPSSEKTSKQIIYKDGNCRSLDNLVMKGDKVFKFVISEIPQLIFDLLKKAKLNIKLIDLFFFHQPNKFLLKKISEKLKVHLNKIPSNITEKFGNSSGVTIPIALALNYKKIKKKNSLLCFSGFGAGLKWTAMIYRMKKIKYCKIFEY